MPPKCCHYRSPLFNTHIWFQFSYFTSRRHSRDDQVHCKQLYHQKTTSYSEIKYKLVLPLSTWTIQDNCCIKLSSVGQQLKYSKVVICSLKYSSDILRFINHSFCAVSSNYLHQFEWLILDTN